ncbi:hypothetical protein GI374_16255 [Paracoccus sp. S-4012]|uniref:hypothetical protein n=1 Tax=Paracoccus sp. S-4012 TaxID=2665648 RepID=UPI0012AFDA9F|nr:hypothetical protein [Paracoccus sp. S-4012]MRX51942.1 hypothetical protein [Paracoccus sp. S-4012]
MKDTKPQLRQELPQDIADVTSAPALCHYRHRDDQPTPAHRLDRRDHGAEAPLQQQIRHLFDQPLPPVPRHQRPRL